MWVPIEFPASIRSSLLPSVKVRVNPLGSVDPSLSSVKSKPVEILIPESVVSERLTEKLDCW